MPSSYRVEYRRGPDVLTLGHVTQVFLHHTTLAPYVTWLRMEHLDDEDGEVVMVDEATSQVVARLHLACETRVRVGPVPPDRWAARR